MSADVDVARAILDGARVVSRALSVVADSAIAAVVLIVAMMILVPIAGALLAADGVAWIWRGVRGCLNQ